MQLITVYAPGTAEQKVCTRPAGSICTLSLCAYTTPLVPIVVKALPARATPVPMAPAMLSAAPPATGMPSSRPVSFAASALMRPATALLSRSGGSRLMGSPSAAAISSDQRRFGTSSRLVPLASLISEANTPVSFRRT